MKFTIAIPAYKAKYLDQTIQSILKQTYKDFELIIVNDDSPEDLESIVNSYNYDNRIRYYKNNKNCGAINVVDNWNICLNYALGDYFICIGDDDMLTCNALDEYNKMIIKYPQCETFHSRIKIIDNNNIPISISNVRSEHESIFSFMRNRIEGQIQFIGDFCFKTKTLKNIGGFYKMPLAWGSDDITTYITATKHGVVLINTPTFFYRSSPLTISNNGRTDIKLTAINQENKWYKTYINKLIPIQDGDKETKDIILKKLNTYFIKKRARTIALDIKKNKLHIFLWLFNRKKYELSITTFLYSLLELIRIKYQNNKY